MANFPLLVLAVVLTVPAIVAGLAITAGGIMSKRALRSEVRDLFEARVTRESLA